MPPAIISRRAPTEPCRRKKVTSPMPDVVAVNGDPRELVIGYATLAAQAREDARKLFGHGW